MLTGDVTTGSIRDPQGSPIPANLGSTYQETTAGDTRYNAIFGEFKNIYGMQNVPHGGGSIFASLIHWGQEQPDAAMNHNVYTAPQNRLERFKWLVGVENRLDREVMQTYRERIVLLENTESTSIIQLKNKMVAFWHCDSQVKDYSQFKFEAQARARNNIIGRIFFACVGFVFRRFYNPAQVIQTARTLEDRSRNTFATLGGFTLNGKEYKVVAFHLLVDENCSKESRVIRSENERRFGSLSYGKTDIGIYEKQQYPNLSSFGHHGRHHNFCVNLVRNRVGEGLDYWSSKSSEESMEQHAVSNVERHLEIGSMLEYRDRTRDVHGSDRLLDQKLTQIMIEMAKQNKNIEDITVTSCHDDLPVLVAGGFDSNDWESVMEEVDDFRSQEGNKLFPPYKDYRSVSTQYPLENYAKNIVSYSRGAHESWSDIISREPILKPEAAILPEYWARKPNIVEE